MKEDQVLDAIVEIQNKINFLLEVGNENEDHMQLQLKLLQRFLYILICFVYFECVTLMPCVFFLS